ncbi:MAG: hypothetical protein RMH75_04525 [Archaeoglobaceae archaeon]|nr:hypothetical protein [Archaeoglobaceae archaeon]MDW7989913.1 hypothetical protein [Archaeoglobaceae archaeon]
MIPRRAVEVDKYILEENWSEVISNHRAFLSDEKNRIFSCQPVKDTFLPIGKV